MKKEKSICLKLFPSGIVFILYFTVLTSGCSFINPDSRYISKVSDAGIMGVFNTIITDSLIFCDCYTLQVYSCDEQAPLTAINEKEEEGDFNSMKYDGKHLAAFKDSAILIYNPLSLSRAIEEHVNFEYGSVEIDGTLLYFIPSYSLSEYIYIYNLDFLHQEINLTDSFWEPEANDIILGNEICFLSKYDSIYFCKADSSHRLEKIVGFSTEYKNVSINCDTLFMATNNDMIVKYYLENNRLKGDTTLLDIHSIRMDGEDMRYMYSDGDFFYCVYEINYNGMLFAYSRTESKFVSWIEEPGVWICGFNKYFIYANSGIYLKPK
ncbi:MAG: hypothetical protein PHW02_01210 [bacterium]|nr:hypothetical protein [bacterium]